MLASFPPLNFAGGKIIPNIDQTKNDIKMKNLEQWLKTFTHEAIAVMIICFIAATINGNIDIDANPILAQVTWWIGNITFWAVLVFTLLRTFFAIRNQIYKIY